MKKILSLIAVIILTACNNQTKQATSAQTDTAKAEKVMPAQELHFAATGNEPFWALNINDRIVFKLLGGDTITTLTPAGIKLMDVAATSYRAQTDSGLLNVIIYDKICINDMSGDTLPKTVEVYLGDKKFRGCGRFK